MRNRVITVLLSLTQGNSIYFQVKEKRKGTDK
jgi:hypothetical protein